MVNYFGNQSNIYANHWMIFLLTNGQGLKKSDSDKIMALHEYVIDGNENKKMIETNHFIIQQVRIPLKENPTIKKYCKWY